MTIAHEYLKAQAVNTRLGEIQLDDRGIVVGLTDVKFDPAELLSLPGFRDADLFPPPGYKPGEGVPEPTVREDVDDDKLWEIIQKITEGDKNLNREGYVDMKILLDTLTTQGFKTVTGTRRKELTDTRQKKEEAK